MQTLTNHAIFKHLTIRVDTEAPLQFVDLTDDLDALVAESGLRTGVVNVQTLHTTTAVTFNELEPLLLTDLTALLDRLAPTNLAYRHDDAALRAVNYVVGERANGHSHCRAALLGSTVGLNVSDGRLQRGRWGRVLFVELDGPRRREVSVVLVGGVRP